LSVVRARRIGALREHTLEIVAVLLAGAGLGVGVGALTVGRGASARGITRPANSATVTHFAGSPAKQAAPLGPASAGVQPGREGAGAPGGHSHDPGAAAAAGAAPALDASSAASFERLAASLPGRVELTVAPLGAGMSATLGGDMAAHGWSTTKVAVLAALLRASGDDLSAEEQSLAQSAITESNNESVLSLFHDLEQIEGSLTGASAYMQELFRRSGDEETVVATAAPPPGAVTTFGQTEWKPSNAVKFFRALALGCLLPTEATSYVLDLMRHIEPSESWGLGSAGFRTVAFKGGWGPEPDGAYLVRQSGIVDVGSSRAVAVALVAFPPPGGGSFEAGTAMLTETARWLRGHLELVPRASVACG
jgi:hypothetical protein